MLPGALSHESKEESRDGTTWLGPTELFDLVIIAGLDLAEGLSVLVFSPFGSLLRFGAALGAGFSLGETGGESLGRIAVPGSTTSDLAACLVNEVGKEMDLWKVFLSGRPASGVAMRLDVLDAGCKTGLPSISATAALAIAWPDWIFELHILKKWMGAKGERKRSYNKNL